jgi:hypothetical protein
MDKAHIKRGGRVSYWLGGHTVHTTYGLSLSSSVNEQLGRVLPFLINFERHRDSGCQGKRLSQSKYLNERDIFEKEQITFST